MDTSILFAGQSSLINAVSYLLLHSLWMGALLALIAFLIIALTRKAASGTRYNLLLVALSLFAVAMTGLAIYTLIPGGGSITPGGLTPAAVIGHATTVYATDVNESWDQQLFAIINKYSAPIVLGWLLIVLMRSVRLAAGLITIRRLRTRNLQDADAHWVARMRALALQMGVRRVVSLKKSAAVKVPIVIGHLKPMIIVPIQFFTSLSASHAEAVLLHELAHIVRKDYLVNILVNLLETLFFFNPAVVWVNHLLRKERENCCDDLAISHVADREDYINALLSCLELETTPPVFAAALFTKPKRLLNRVRRILYYPVNHSISNMEKSLMTAAILLVFVGAMAFRPSSGSAAPNLNLSDSTAANSHVPDRLTMYPGSAWNPIQYSSVLFFYDTLPGSSKSHPPSKCLPSMPPALVPPATPATPLVPAIDGQQAQTSGLPNAPQSPTPPPSINASAPQVSAPDAPQQPGSPKMSVPVSINAPLAVPVQIAVTPVPPAPAEVTDPKANQLILELEKDGIIAGAANVSFTLSNKVFVVNGKKQPAEVFTRYRDKYAADVGNGEWTWIYNCKTNTSTKR